MLPPSSQQHIDLVYNHVFESLKQGKQPGSYKQMARETGVSMQSIKTAIRSLLDTGHLRCWKSDPEKEYSVMHYDIPGEDFPSTPQDAETDMQKNWRLAWAAVVKIRALAAKGHSIEEIAGLVPDHIDGTGWSESSIGYVIRGITPNYMMGLKKM